MLLLTGTNPTSKEAQTLSQAGATVIQVPVQPGGGLDLAAVMAILADRGITRVLAECGSELAAGLVRADVVDRIAWFRAATLIGGDGLGALAALNIDKAAQARRFEREQSLALGEDVLETYRRTTY